MKKYVIFILALLFIVGTVDAQIQRTRGTPPSWQNALKFWEPRDSTTIITFTTFRMESDFVSDSTEFLQYIISAGGSVANTAQLLGYNTITTGAAVDNRQEVATNDSLFHRANLPGFEARIRVNDVDSSTFFIGFVNVDTTVAIDTLAFFITVGSADTAKLGWGVTDGFGWLWDSDATTDYWYGVSANDSTASTQLSSAIATSDAEWVVLRAEMDAAGTIHYFLNNHSIGTQTGSVATSAGLYFYYGGGTRSGAAAETFDIDYVRINAAVRQ